MLSTNAIRLQFAMLVLAWSTSFVWIKILVDEMSPAWLAVWRLVLGALVVTVFSLLQRLRNRSAKSPSPAAPAQHSGLQWKVILVVAVFGTALPFILIHSGETSVDSSIAAVLMGTMPLVTFVFARFIIGEQLNTMQLCGLALGFVGLLCLIGLDVLAGLGRTWGQLAIAAGAASYALSSTLVRKLGSSSSLDTVALTLWVAVVLVLPFAIADHTVPHLPTTPLSWIALLLLGGVCTGCAAVVYFQLLASVSVNTFAQINYIIPVLGYVWGVTFLGEPLRWQAILSAALILCAVRLVLSGKNTS